jgi:hypothetical protein
MLKRLAAVAAALAAISGPAAAQDVVRLSVRTGSWTKVEACGSVIAGPTLRL